ncbi:MAG: aminomethyl-transferring glycine dehydrogenase [Candidatus Neomarinimicrobiota bacterium]
MPAVLDTADTFQKRHIGPSEEEVKSMLDTLGLNSLDELIHKTVPAAILSSDNQNIGEVLSEFSLIRKLKEIAGKNIVFRSYLGQGYNAAILPPVILRNILENPGWYTQYTPYQAEISQGRLEALLNFQTMVADLTGFKLANASLLDESTAAAEAMIMFYNMCGTNRKNQFFVADSCHIQTIEVLKTRSEPLGIQLVIGPYKSFKFTEKVFGSILQYPAADGAIEDYTDFCRQAHEYNSFVAAAADLISLTLLKPPEEFGADAALGSTQRFGIPMGYGGPHAAYFTVSDIFKRKLPGRIIGISKDNQGNRALRMALQTREQHIRREKATSNICTSQVLLAIMAGAYAVYHGPQGLRAIAERIHGFTKALARLILLKGHELVHEDIFDTLRIHLKNISPADIRKAALRKHINLRYFKDGTIGVSLDETVTWQDLLDLAQIFGLESSEIKKELETLTAGYTGKMKRKSLYLTHSVFNAYHSETDMMRYLHRLETRDLALNSSMIPLGSCTMKLNAVSVMLPVSWPEFSDLHPFIPPDQALGYKQIIDELSAWLCNITGLKTCSMMPNSGAQGEYTGLLTIRAFHKDRGNANRNICLIPASAHGTNPASAIMAGMKVVVVKCDQLGNIDLEDLKARTKQHGRDLAAMMITYPSTHGVFEESFKDISKIVHQAGGQVYVDGANLNALVGLARLGELGADVCHINLHKTFAIPHGGGGPGMGPITAAEHLAPFLPGHPVVKTGGEKASSAVSGAPFGSAGILPISWAYISLLGSKGLKLSTQTAILNANYMAEVLKDQYPVLYSGKRGMIAHEFIIDLRPFKKSAGITEEDVAKRLMDYGFHAPTMSFPVPGTLMIEPTESESKSELDRFCQALLLIRAEISAIETGEMDKSDNLLKNAPHTAAFVTTTQWDHPYSRETAAFPAPWLKEHKYWPVVSRIDNAYGDRNLVCTCTF